MACIENNNLFRKIVYAKVKVNGKVELVPMKLYADGSVRKEQ